MRRGAEILENIGKRHGIDAAGQRSAWLGGPDSRPPVAPESRFSEPDPGDPRKNRDINRLAGLPETPASEQDF